MLFLVFLGIFSWGIIILGVILGIIKFVQQEKFKQHTLNSYVLYYKDFENGWIRATGSGKYGNRDGFKYRDRPGCYVITIYTNPVTDGIWKNYENIYIGQSVRVYQRVHNHFTGKGNGDVYADIKYGKWVYVRFIMCDEYELNDKEIELIALFNATKSYNKTRGGK